MKPEAAPCRGGHPRPERSRRRSGAVVARLRARGWHISLWEIQRAQDVIAYLLRAAGAPADRRRAATGIFARSSAAGRASWRRSPKCSGRALRARRPRTRRSGTARRLRRHWLVGLAGSAVHRSPRRCRHPSFERGNPPPHPLRQQPRVSWTTWVWIGAVVASAAAASGLLWLAMRKRFRRRPAPRDPGHDLELRWATDHPLDAVECVRIARSLRIRRVSAATRSTSGARSMRRSVPACGLRRALSSTSALRISRGHRAAQRARRAGRLPRPDRRPGRCARRGGAPGRLAASYSG